MTKRVALVVVDLQYDFLPPNGSLAVKDGQEIISKINDLLDIEKYHWASIVATQDWHPKDSCTFASQHNVAPYTEIEFTHLGGAVDDKGHVKTEKHVVWPDHCIQDTKGSSLEDSFAAKFESLGNKIPKSIVHKGYLKDREYYSCFQDCWGIHKTEMADFLKENDITDVYFTGLAYDYCVLNSAIDCSKLGYKTYVLRDYSKSVFAENIEQTDESYRKGGVQIISGDKIQI